MNAVDRVLPRAYSDVSSVLGREERQISLPSLNRKRVLVTGANGSIGRFLVPTLWALDAFVLATDIHQEGHPLPDEMLSMDVRNFDVVLQTVRMFRPDVIVHLAADKHAPRGEVYPWQTAQTNIEGTHNVISTGVPVVLASTCKAGSPETVYGASKSVAERMVLNAGGVVARLFNVIQTHGNVFEIWKGLPEDAPIPVTPCKRYFITIREAVSLLVWAISAPTGRYALDPGEPRYMPDVAAALFPKRELEYWQPRRGDRLVEPLHGVAEAHAATGTPFVNVVVNAHDDEHAETLRVAA